MRTLFKNGQVVNVFTGEIDRVNVLIEDEKIIGLGAYADGDADRVEDVAGKTLCPGFIDGHIHIESTMLLPYEFARACVPHGTTAVIADPHEIANVCGRAGIDFMLEASEGLPLTVYIVVPSCVPATPFDENGANLDANDAAWFFSHPRVLGLGEVMDYTGVQRGDEKLVRLIAATKARRLIVNGHAPLVTGRALDRYISAGIYDDHECSSAEEAMERIRKGQRVMIRQGTSARNLKDLLPLFEPPWAERCLLVTDDKHPADLLNAGHIDDIIRSAARAGKSAVTAIRMATLQAAEYYGLADRGAIAPGRLADIAVLDDLNNLRVEQVYCRGKKTAADGVAFDFKPPAIHADVRKTIRNSFYLDSLTADKFAFRRAGRAKCRVIQLIRGQLLTDEQIAEIDFDRDDGVDAKRDILKLAVIERHLNTGHIGLGFIRGIGIRGGAIASSVSHDSHNLVVIGSSDSDMALAANRVRALNGGAVVVKNGEIAAEMPLPYAGLMTDLPAEKIARQNERVRKAAYALGASEDIEPFMVMAFVSLPVIPHIKMTTKGLVDVDAQKLVPLFIEEE